MEQAVPPSKLSLWVEMWSFPLRFNPKTFLSWQPVVDPGGVYIQLQKELAEQVIQISSSLSGRVHFENLELPPSLWRYSGTRSRQHFTRAVWKRKSALRPFVSTGRRDWEFATHPGFCICVSLDLGPGISDTKLCPRERRGPRLVEHLFGNWESKIGFIVTCRAAFIHPGTFDQKDAGRVKLFDIIESVRAKNWVVKEWRWGWDTCELCWDGSDSCVGNTKDTSFEGAPSLAGWAPPLAGWPPLSWHENVMDGWGARSLRWLSVLVGHFSF